MKIDWRIPFFLLLFPLLLWAKQAELTPHDVRVKIEEILRAHATHHTLNEELISRSLSNFLQELDPNYCYLIEPEVLPWIKPSPEQLALILDQIKKEDVTAFREIYGVMVKAIERRRLLEAQLDTLTPPEIVDNEEFKDMTWATSVEDLKTRLHHIRGFQLKTARKILTAAEQANFQKRLEKRRVSREDTFLSSDPLKRDHLLFTTILKATSSALDSQTSYFTPAEANQLMMQVQQRLYGIGAQLRDDINGLTIVRILENSPLSRLPEIEIGDRIIAVNQEPVIGLDITDAVELIRGPEGTSVNLTLLRQKENNEDIQFDAKIVRGEIVLKEGRFESSFEPFGSGVIAILRLHSFYQDSQSSSASDLYEEIEKFKKDHVLRGIILDLRNNTGGLLPQAVSVAGLFMNKGVVVSVKDNTGFIQRLRNLETTVAWDGPLIILTNRFSASASEIVAQTLQEYGRALIVGDKETFGKGTFQTFSLESKNSGKVNTKGEYKVTRGCYYTVSGKTPQKTGVKADIVVAGHFAEVEVGERFSKYPLEPDQIDPCFDDDLSDIPVIHRYQVSKLYKSKLQPIVTLYKSFLPQLNKNATDRLSNDLDHQNLMHIISSKNSNPEPSSLGSNDSQLQETVNLMKDLIFMMNRRVS